jgi:hypothetical protein
MTLGKPHSINQNRLEIKGDNYSKLINSTSNTNQAFGGITPG